MLCLSFGKGARRCCLVLLALVMAAALHSVVTMKMPNTLQESLDRDTSSASSHTDLAVASDLPMPADTQDKKATTSEASMSAAGRQPASSETPAKKAQPTSSETQAKKAPKSSEVDLDKLLQYDPRLDPEKTKRLVFLHIPKNAGTTVEDVGKDAGIKWGRFFNMYRGKRLGKLGMKCDYWHMPPDIFPSPSPYEDAAYEVFCVTRDPWDKLVSEFMYRWSHDRSEDHLHSCDAGSFRQWLQTSLDGMEKGNLYQKNCHMVPQSQFLGDGHGDGRGDGRGWCKHILRFEHLTEDFNQLMSMFYLKVRLTDKDESNVAHDSECKELFEMPLGKLFPASLRKQVRRIYARDFDHLGDSLQD